MTQGGGEATGAFWPSVWPLQISQKTTAEALQWTSTPQTECTFVPVAAETSNTAMTTADATITLHIYSASWTRVDKAEDKQTSH